MEHVRGEHLAQKRREDLVARFDDLAVQCLRALDYIHSRGLLHNDIKPQNIMIHAPFQVKLLDFGLARGQTESGGAGLSGTIHYIAPERFGGQAVDGRSDLYSLGVVLYELLTGVRPHAGEDSGQVVGAILRGQVRPPRQLNSAIPERIEGFVMSLLERIPASRPAGAARALELLNTGRADPLRLDTPETYASFVTSGRFLGRNEELQTLMDLATRHAQAAATDDALPRLVLLSGPSGIGKSRLLRELKNRLQLCGIRNLTGRCYEAGGVPFHPFVEILGQLPRRENLAERKTTLAGKTLRDPFRLAGMRGHPPRQAGNDDTFRGGRRRVGIGERVAIGRASRGKRRLARRSAVVIGREHRRVPQRQHMFEDGFVRLRGARALSPRLQPAA